MTRRVVDSRFRVRPSNPQSAHLIKNRPDTLGFSSVTVVSVANQNRPTELAGTIFLSCFAASRTKILVTLGTGSVVGGDERPEIFASALEGPRLARVFIFQGSVGANWGKLAPMLPDTCMDSFSGSNRPKGNPARNSFSNLQKMYIHKLMNERAKGASAESLPMNGGCDDK
jgi:hypothetical protein